VDPAALRAPTGYGVIENRTVGIFRVLRYGRASHRSQAAKIQIFPPAPCPFMMFHALLCQLIEEFHPPTPMAVGNPVFTALNMADRASPWPEVPAGVVLLAAEQTWR